MELRELEERADKLNKELGWRRAWRDVMQWAVQYKDSLPQAPKDALLDLYAKGPPSDAPAS